MPIYMHYGTTPGVTTSKLSLIHGMRKGLQTVSLGNPFSFGVTSPRDTASGQSAGKRQHEPITIIKEVDKSDALLSHLLHSGRTIPKLYLSFYRTSSPTGHPLISMNLSDVEVNVRHSQPEPYKGSISGNRMELEEIGLTFQKIEVTFTSGGASAKDDWEART